MPAPRPLRHRRESTRRLRALPDLSDAPDFEPDTVVSRPPRMPFRSLLGAIGERARRHFALAEGAELPEGTRLGLVAREAGSVDAFLDEVVALMRRHLDVVALDPQGRARRLPHAGEPAPVPESRPPIEASPTRRAPHPLAPLQTGAESRRPEPSGSAVFGTTSGEAPAEAHDEPGTSSTPPLRGARPRASPARSVAPAPGRTPASAWFPAPPGATHSERLRRAELLSCAALTLSGVALLVACL